MRPLSLYRAIKSGAVHFWRNIWLSLAATGIMVLTLFTLAILLVATVLGQNVLQFIEAKIDVTAFMADDADESAILTVKQDIEGRDDVVSVVYITREQALEAFRDRHADNPLIAQALQEVGENPLQAQLIIRADSPAAYEGITDILREPRYKPLVARVTFEDNRAVIERLQAVLSATRNIGFALVGALALIAVLVTFNTIRLAIYSYHREIDIMRLVGASSWFIRGPFIIEGILAGLIAAIVTLVLFYPVVGIVSPHLSAFFTEGQFSLYHWSLQNILFITLLLTGSGVILGALSSIIAVRRYLRT